VATTLRIPDLDLARVQRFCAARILYWADRNERWHRYRDLDPSENVSTLLDEIDEDPTCIFFG